MRVFNTVEEMKECVGQEIGVSDWFAIDQDRINDFPQVRTHFGYAHKPAPPPVDS